MTTFERWAAAAAVALGVAVGIGAYTFVYAKGASYLGHDPAACANCHVMREHYSAWLSSSHRSVAGCNDCHTPHALVPKYVTKARNGFWHSFYFTTGRYPDPLRITPRNHEVTEGACRHCHEPIVSAIDDGAHGSSGGRMTGDDADAPAQGRSPAAGEKISCTRCHPNVGHWVR